MKKKTILLRIDEIDTALKSLSKQIKNLPEGTIQFSKNGTFYKWYQKHKGKRTYIKKSNRHHAEKLALKKCLQLEAAELKKEKLALNAYLYHYDSEKAPTNSIVECPPLLDLMRSQSFSLSDELRCWEEESYTANENYPENLIHKGINGRLFRSKSESMIDALLYQANIPHRYECELLINDISFHPDFTIRHPETGEFFYWEHFGMIDIPDYYQDTLSKLRTFYNNGLIPTKNLIITFETKESPLCMDEVKFIIKKYFL